VDENHDSYWENFKDDIVANISIFVKKFKIYLFNKNNILKFEIKDISYSPSDLKSTEKVEAVIHDLKTQPYRKVNLIINKSVLILIQLN